MRVLIHNIYIFIKYITFHFLKAKLDINNQISSDNKQLSFKGWVGGQKCIAAIRNDILIKTFLSIKSLEAHKRDPFGAFLPLLKTPQPQTKLSERKATTGVSTEAVSDAV